MSKVYIVNVGPHDYSEAKTFGELIFCTRGSLDKFDTSQMFREIVEALYDSEAEDYILLTSLTSLCCVACSVFTAKHYRLNLLIFDPREGRYVSRSLNFNNI